MQKTKDNTLNKSSAYYSCYDKKSLKKSIVLNMIVFLLALVWCVLAKYTTMIKQRQTAHVIVSCIVMAITLVVVFINLFLLKNNMQSGFDFSQIFIVNGSSYYFLDFKNVKTVEYSEVNGISFVFTNPLFNVSNTANKSTQKEYTIKITDKYIIFINLNADVQEKAIRKTDVQDSKRFAYVLMGRLLSNSNINQTDVKDSTRFTYVLMGGLPSNNNEIDYLSKYQEKVKMEQKNGQIVSLEELFAEFNVQVVTTNQEENL